MMSIEQIVEKEHISASKFNVEKREISIKDEYTHYIKEILNTIKGYHTCLSRFGLKPKIYKRNFSTKTNTGKLHDEYPDLMEFKMKLISAGISIKSNTLTIDCSKAYMIRYDPVAKMLSVLPITWDDIFSFFFGNN